MIRHHRHHTPLLEEVEQTLDCGRTLAAEVLVRMRRHPRWAFRWDAQVFEAIAWEVAESIQGDPDDPAWELVVSAPLEEAHLC